MEKVLNLKYIYGKTIDTLMQTRFSKFFLFKALKGIFLSCCVVAEYGDEELYFFYQQDKIAAPKDVERLCDSVSSVVACVEVKRKGWTHADFEIGSIYDLATFVSFILLSQIEVCAWLCLVQ